MVKYREGEKKTLKEWEALEKKKPKGIQFTEKQAKALIGVKKTEHALKEGIGVAHYLFKKARKQKGRARDLLMIGSGTRI